MRDSLPLTAAMPAPISTPADRALSEIAELRREIRGLRRRLENLEATAAPPVPDDLAPRSVAAIVEHVARDYGFTARLLCAHWRRRDIVEARQVAMAIARETFGFSSAVIGRAIGGRDHTTVLSAVEAINTRRGSERDLRARMDRLTEELSMQGCEQ